jgi:ribose transport system substrate-binding protein
MKSTIDVRTTPAVFLPGTSRLIRFLILISVLFGIPGGYTVVNAVADELATAMSLEEMQRNVAAASAVSPPWDGPTQGPKASTGRTIAIINEDLRNGGILGVAQGIREAVQVLGWKVRMFDAGGTPAGRKKAAAQALDADPDGVILNGADASIMAPFLSPLVQQHIPIVGWHVGPKAGVMEQGGIAMNVSTDPIDVARVTAMAAIVGAKGKAGVVIFTDSNFAIALAKSKAMAEVIKSCQKCTLLEVRDLAISDSARLMPAVSRNLLQRYGKRWTHALAINDIYFDHAVPEFILAGPEAQHVEFLSAGDGSSAAYVRILAGSFQVGTVAEPLNLQGWQLVDELNRLMEGQPPSGYVAPVHLITPENAEYDGGADYHYDPANGYRDVYRRIWGR